LLKTLYATGPISIRALAKALGRDYKNVYTDVQALQHIGLVTRQRDGRLLVPWTRIIAEFSLAA
jgi:predicted transcriptional regulator